MNLINQIVDVIFPRCCPVCHDIVSVRGELICPQCRNLLNYVKDPYCIKCGKQMKESSDRYCSRCSKRSMEFTEGRAVFVYDDIMRKSIYRFKYGQRQEYAQFYANEIYIRYRVKIEEWNPDVIIPIPLHKSKLKKRGYNQAYLIAKQLSILTNIPVDNKLLSREKKTQIQKNLGVGERESNLKNAFKISANRVQYLSAMLIDDIYTTGATFCSASNTLKSCGITCIYCISLSIGLDF